MHYSNSSKLKFYLSLLFYKLTSPAECRNFRAKVFFNEFAFSAATLSGLNKLESLNKNHIVLRTTLGIFMIRDICADINIASPAFERQDINELFKKIDDALVKHHHVLFIDAGASFGKFTVAVGNRFRRYTKQLSILAFEPDSENFRLLTKNVELNNLRNVKIFQTALSNTETVKKFFYYRPMKQIVSFPTPEQINVHTTMLDTYSKYISSDDNTELFIKLDVEGHEIETLQGSNKILRNKKNITLLVEDSTTFTSYKLIQYLSSHGTFLDKKTVYNSFWKL